MGKLDPRSKQVIFIVACFTAFSGITTTQELVLTGFCMVAAIGVMLIFDWKIGLPLLILMVLGFLLQMSCMGKDTMEFMKTYQDSLEDMNHEAVEYVRGISVVKVFGQSVYSIRKFKDAIDS